MATVAWKFQNEIRQWCAETVSLSEMGRRCGTKAQYVKAVILELGIPYDWPNPKGGNRPGPLSKDWKGGRIVENPEGYILVHKPDHPHCNRHGYVREHRLVVENHLGRHLGPKEVVHHKNGICDDNRIENLQVFGSNAEHLKHELSGKCPNWTEKGRATLQELSRNRDSRGRLLPKRSHPKNDE